MARRKQSELGDIATRDRILNSAKKYFLEYGFQAAPLRKIAKDAGLLPVRFTVILIRKKLFFMQ